MAKNHCIDDPRGTRKLGGGIIWWRIKPEIECRGNLWHGYVRFATSPALSEDFLTRLGKPEMQEELT